MTFFGEKLNMSYGTERRDGPQDMLEVRAMGGIVGVVRVGRGEELTQAHVFCLPWQCLVRMEAPKSGQDEAEDDSLEGPKRQ